MNRDAPSLAALESLATSTDIRDRAFAASVLTLRETHAEHQQAAALYARIRETALNRHAAVRAQIRNGTLDARRFLAELQALPADIRDHFVEELLDIAYPPLAAEPPPPGADCSLPSGLGEILFALDHAALGPEKAFVDLGSGAGKVVLLTALLSGARAYGVELDPELVTRARAAAAALNLGNAEFIHGDITECALPSADVYYSFIPSSRAADAVARIREFAREGKVLLFSQKLDLARFPWLRSANTACYWLEMYEGS